MFLQEGVGQRAGVMGQQGGEGWEGGCGLCVKVQYLPCTLWLHKCQQTCPGNMVKSREHLSSQILIKAGEEKGGE